MTKDIDIIAVVRHFIDDLGMMGVGQSEHYHSYVKSVWIRDKLWTLSVVVSPDCFGCSVWKINGVIIPQERRKIHRFYFAEADALDKVERFLETGKPHDCDNR